MRNISFLAMLVLLTSSAEASEKILLIGDSHTVMDFGATLSDELGHNTKRFAVAGTAANDWLPDKICKNVQTCQFTYGYATPKGSFSGPLRKSFPGISEALKITSAKIVIIALGTNDASQRCNAGYSQRVKPFGDLIDRVGKRKCYWVGPPSYSRGPVFESCHGLYNDFVAELKQVAEAGKCKFIDSREVLDDLTGKPIEADYEDEVHFSARLGQLWARHVAQKIVLK
jgi:hypothetical protein